MNTGATISDCGRYRYQLWREFDRAGDDLFAAPEPGSMPVMFVMLNPSTADAATDDPTIRRCVGYARRWGASGIKVRNLFALRATDPKELYTTHDPVGPENDFHILAGCRDATHVVCAWGAHGSLHGRDKHVAAMLRDAGATLYHLGLTTKGQPRHPLYLPGDLQPTRWEAGV